MFQLGKSTNCWLEATTIVVQNFCSLAAHCCSMTLVLHAFLRIYMAMLDVDGTAGVSAFAKCSTNKERKFSSCTACKMKIAARAAASHLLMHWPHVK